ncbi:hypothetical protein [Streptomyces ureilyticus]|uniref:C2H2-type domain-containing protein n=1 Tax=Streptomyces ureilyticus TaxID=1775131 RepID=A0ABX0DQY0_9ACTN|nr:hypothetical protein [Streptomyces ureilyticus]NGO43770.1 hypothetical protein [Streptomyces ureilyticus]
MSADRELLKALLDALDVPLAEQADDDQARARLLDVRVSHAVIALESVLKHGPEDVEDSARWLREETAKRPVTYTPWERPDPKTSCSKCRTVFDPADTRHDGHDRHGDGPFCRRCIDRCHESTDAFHACVICDPSWGETR